MTTVTSEINMVEKSVSEGDFLAAHTRLVRICKSYDLKALSLCLFYTDRDMDRYFKNVDTNNRTWIDVVEAISGLTDTSVGVFYKCGEKFRDVKKEDFEAVIPKIHKMALKKDYSSQHFCLYLHYYDGYYNEVIERLMYYVEENQFDWPIAKCFTHVSKLVHLKDEVDALKEHGFLKTELENQVGYELRQTTDPKYRMEWFYYDKDCNELRNLSKEEIQWLYNRVEKFYMENTSSL